MISQDVKPRRRSLYRKYAFYFVVLVTGSLFISGLVGFYFTYHEKKQAILELQSEKASGAASRIEAYIQQVHRQIGWLRFPQTRRASLDQRRIEYLYLLYHVPAIVSLTLVDNTGREHLRVSRLNMNQARIRTPDWSRASDRSRDEKSTLALDGTSYFSSLYLKDGTEPRMTIAVAGTGPDADFILAEVDLKSVWEMISQMRMGNEGLAYIVDSRGRLIAHPDADQVLRTSDLSALPHVKSALNSKGVESSKRMATSHNSQGHEVLTAYASIGLLGWHVFVEQPVSDAFAPFYSSLKKRTGLLLLTGMICAMMASLYLARRMVKPIQAIQGGAAQIAKGNLEQRLDLGTGDELDDLASQFNTMAIRLKESYAGLERKVEQRTRELTEALDQQVAISEILRLINSSSTDLQPVLDAILEKATALCDARCALFVSYDEDIHHNVMQRGASPLFDSWLTNNGLSKKAPGTALGRIITERRGFQIPDLMELPDCADPDSIAFAMVNLDNGRTFLATPVLNKEGRLIGAILIYRREVRPFTQKQIDLVNTFANQAGMAIENMRLFNEIQEKNRQLEIASQHKSEFLATMSHELRTPLNAIIGFSEVLQERMFGELNKKQAEYIEDIHSSGKHLLSLINDILDLSKIEAGRMELNLSVFDVSDALQNVVMLVRERATHHGISLGLDISPDIGNCMADQRKFKQILLNLLSNAVKFTPKGGSIWVRAMRLNDQVEVSVSDTGIGIAQEDLTIIFTEFRQVGADHLKKAEGTGLGLALAKKFVELHGGAIELKSEVGKGSTFTFALPDRLLEVS
jgi:signal transduction histidine kinase/HAMP domain-containing protein